MLDERAVLILPVVAISDANGEPMLLRHLRRWLPSVSSFSASLNSAPSSVSLVLDRFAYDLHVSDIGHATDVHSGDEFLAASRSGVDLYIVDDADPRRSPPEELDAAARDGRVLGARTTAFQVDHLSE